jgi:DnaK suppressor protein
MNKPVLLNTNHIQSELRAQRGVLLGRIRAHMHQSDDPVALALVHAMPDTDDALLIDMLTDLDLAVLGHEISELRDIEAALKQIAAGTYGLCADCGQEIDLARLRAQPAARQCLECRTAFEKRRGIVRAAMA